MKQKASKMYDVLELDLRISLQGVKEKQGYGTWCQDDFREELFSKGIQTGSVVAEPIMSKAGNLTHIKVVAEVTYVSPYKRLRS